MVACVNAMFVAMAGSLRFYPRRLKVRDMTEHRITRRDLIKAAAVAISGAALPGCRGRRRQMVTEEVTGYVWDVVADGNDGPGPRSRHGLVHDTGARTTVLFGGVIWGKQPVLKSD